MREQVNRGDPAEGQGVAVVLPEPTDQDQIVGLCSALHKAVRAVRFYPPGHPLATSALATLDRHFADRLSRSVPLQLDVTENGFAYHDAVMGEQEDLRDSISFLLFRDGIRALIFTPGLTTGEIHSLVDVFAQAPDLDRAEQDITTVLWERDLGHLECQVVDPLLDQATGDATFARLCAHLEASRGAVLDGRQRWNSLPEAAGDSADLLEAETRVGQLVGPEEHAQLEAEIAAEPDVFAELVVVLAEVLASTRHDDDLTTATKALANVLCAYMEWGNLAALNLSIGRLEQMQQLVPQRADAFAAALDPLTDPERVARLIQKIDGPLMARRGEAETMLLRLRDRLCPTLLDLLVQVEGRAARKCLLNVLAADGGVPTTLIVPRLADSRWYVVRNMVFLLGAIGDPSAIIFLEKTLDHADERVRSETVRALSCLGGPRAAYLVTSALNDPSPLVRTVAARTLTSLSGPDAVAHLLRQLGARDFAARSETERDAVFESLGRLGDDRAVAVLDSLWATRSLFRSRTLSLRLKALQTLGSIGTPAARKSLARAARSGDDALRQQARLCLVDAERRMVRE